MFILMKEVGRYGDVSTAMFNEIYMLVVVRTYEGLAICIFIYRNFRKKTLHATNACIHACSSPHGLQKFILLNCFCDKIDNETIKS